MWVDLERSQVSHLESPEAKEDGKDRVRRLYERIISHKMKQRRAKFVFKRWLEFEQALGSEKSVDRVKALAKEYVEKQQGMDREGDVSD